jgi:23S rRNA (guanosine2251-2'-O)-methyltransferase
MLIIGINPVLETLDFDAGRINKIFLLEGIDNSRINKIVELAKKKNIKVERKNRAYFDSIIDKKDKSGGISQGVIAEAKEFEYYELKKLLEDTKDKKEALIVILDEIQDPHNLGAIMRTCASVKADGVVISEKNSAKVNHTVMKASAGAINFLKISLSGNIYKAIEMIKQSEFFVFGTSLKNSKDIYGIKMSGRCAVVFGGESKGIRANIVRLCDELINIPIPGKTESLNVSVSAGVVLYEILRQRNPK